MRDRAERIPSYSPSTSKPEQEEFVDRCPTSRHTCREEGVGEACQSVQMVKYVHYKRTSSLPASLTGSRRFRSTSPAPPAALRTASSMGGRMLGDDSDEC